MNPAETIQTNPLKLQMTLYCHCGSIKLKPSVHLIVTIAEKSVSDQMDTSLLTIPVILMIITIAIDGIGSGSIPAIASAIVTIITITAIIWTQASNREQSE